MIRVFLFLLILPLCAYATYTEFYCQTTGSNLNAGSGTTDAAAFTYASGTWVAATGVFTVASGNPSGDGVAVGDFASVYADGATVTVFVGRVTARDTTTITVSLTAKSGTAPVDGTANRTLKIGGAWAGPNGASMFPWGFVQSTMTDSAADVTRVNVKTGTYTISAGVTHTNVGPIVFEGYTTNPGDGTTTMSLPLITGTGYPTVNTPYNILQYSGATDIQTRYIEFANNGYDSTTNAGGPDMVSSVSSSTNNVYYRCRFRNSWRNGLRIAAAGGLVVECEGVGCNIDGASAFAVFQADNASTWIRCWGHHTYSQSGPLDYGDSVVFRFVSSSTNRVVYDSCVASNFGGYGFIAGSNNHCVVIRNCVAAFGNRAGAQFSSNANETSSVLIENSIFYGNDTYGIQYRNATWAATVVNCAFGDNTTADFQNGIADRISGTINLSGDPFVDSANGNFGLNSTAGAGAACRNAGIGTFLGGSAADWQGSSYSAKPTGFPDVNAAQHQDAGAVGGQRSYSF